MLFPGKSFDFAFTSRDSEVVQHRLLKPNNFWEIKKKKKTCINGKLMKNIPRKNKCCVFLIY